MADAAQKSQTKAQAAPARPRGPVRHPASAYGDGGRFGALGTLHDWAGNNAVSRLLGIGSPLPDATRAMFESRFGADFSDVRVHNGRTANASAVAFNSNAFTVGNDIVFSANRYSPDTQGGHRLLAHELAHVVQQRRGGPAPALDSSAAHESSADAAATAFVSGGGPVAVQGGTAVGVARDAKENYRDFYWTAFFANRAYAKTIKDWPIDPELGDLWAKVPVRDEAHGGSSPAHIEFADKVKAYQRDRMPKGTKVNGAVDPPTAAALRKSPITRIGVTVVAPHPTPVRGTITREVRAPRNDSLGETGDVVVDVVAGALAKGDDFHKRLIAAAIKGCLAEIRRQMVDEGKEERMNARLAELKNPTTALSFYGSYIAGAGAGLVSPVTDLFGLATLADTIPKLGRELAASAISNASELVTKGGEVATKVKALTGQMSDAVVEAMKEFVDDPSSLLSKIDQAKDGAVELAGDLGNAAGKKVISLFESPWVEEEEKKPDPGWGSVLPDAQDVLLNPYGAVLGTAGRTFDYGSEQVKKKVFSTPWSKMGYEIGRVIGMVIVQVLLLVFSEGVGTAVTKVSSALGELAPFLKTITSAIAKIGEAITAVEKAIEAVAELAFKALSRFKQALKDVLESLGGWLRLLEKAATTEAPAAAKLTLKTADVIADETAKVAPKVHAPPKVETHVASGGAAADDASKSLPKVDAESKVDLPPKQKVDVPPKKPDVTPEKKVDLPSQQKSDMPSKSKPKVEKPTTKAENKPKADAKPKPESKGKKPPSKKKPPAKAPAVSDDPLVVAKIEGPNKGQYWPDGTPQFRRNAGTPTSAPDEKYVVLPKSEAERLGFRPQGAPPKTDIKPRMVNGQQAESAGAGRRTAGPDPMPNGKKPKPAHPVSARTSRKPPAKGAPASTALEADAADPAAAHAFPRTIGADVKQAAGYNALIDAGEKGILRPGNISTGGVDAITARIEDGKAKIFLNDFTTPGTGKAAKETWANWRKELEVAIKGDRLNLGNKKLEDAIRKAFEDGEVYVRTVRVDLPATAGPGIAPGKGTANPALVLGTPVKL